MPGSVCGAGRMRRVRSCRSEPSAHRGDQERETKKPTNKNKTKEANKGKVGPRRPGRGTALAPRRYTNGWTRAPAPRRYTNGWTRALAPRRYTNGWTRALAPRRYTNGWTRAPAPRRYTNGWTRRAVDNGLNLGYVGEARSARLAPHSSVRAFPRARKPNTRKNEKRHKQKQRSKRDTSRNKDRQRRLLLPVVERDERGDHLGGPRRAPPSLARGRTRGANAGRGPAGGSSSSRSRSYATRGYGLREEGRERAREGAPWMAMMTAGYDDSRAARRGQLQI